MVVVTVSCTRSLTMVIVIVVLVVIVVVVVVVTGQLYQIIYSNVLYYPVMYVVPLGTLASLNISLIAELNATKRRTLPVTVTAANTTASSPDVGEIHSRHSRRHRKEDNVTLCVMVIVCVFIVCQTPALLNQIFWVLFPPTERLCGRFHFYYTKLSDLLVVVNSSCNFVVYCLFGATFRRIFLSTVCCCWWWRCGCHGNVTPAQQQQQQHQQQYRQEAGSVEHTGTALAMTEAIKDASPLQECVVTQVKRTPSPPLCHSQHGHLAITL